MIKTHSLKIALLETELFAQHPSSLRMLFLKDTDWQVYVKSSGGLMWFYSLDEDIDDYPFQEVFNRLSDNIKEKVIDHLDLFL